MKIILKGSINHKSHNEGVKPDFLSLPKPDDYSITIHTSKKLKKETLKWKSIWKSNEKCIQVSMESNKNYLYWKNLYELFSVLENKYPDMNNIISIRDYAKSEYIKWEKNLKTIESQISG